MTLVLGSVSKKTQMACCFAARIKKKALGTPGAEQVPVLRLWVGLPRQGWCRCLRLQLEGHGVPINDQKSIGNWVIFTPISRVIT